MHFKTNGQFFSWYSRKLEQNSSQPYRPLDPRRRVRSRLNSAKQRRFIVIITRGDKIKTGSVR